MKKHRMEKHLQPSGREPIKFHTTSLFNQSNYGKFYSYTRNM